MRVRPGAPLPHPDDHDAWTMLMTAQDPEQPLKCELAIGCSFAGSWEEWLAHAPVHVLPHPDDHDAWIQARRTFVGASEIAAVCGLNPYDSALDVYAAKVRGTTKNKPHLEGRATARLGHLLEPVLLADYAARHGVTIERPSSQRHPRYPWAGATPDGISSGGELVQVKLVGASMLHHWTDGPPRYTVLQVQWEMFVTDRRSCVVVAGLGGTDIEDYPIERDEQTIDSARQLVELFWHESIIPRKLPADFDGVATDATLRLLFPAVRGPLRAADEGAITTTRSYDYIREQIKPLEAAKEALAQRIKVLIGDDEGFEWPTGKATWRNSKGSLDKDALAQALLERFVPEAERQSWIDRHTPAQGSRRLSISLKRSY
jgi:putative phage-type endonuclease